MAIRLRHKLVHESVTSIKAVILDWRNDFKFIGESLDDHHIIMWLSCVTVVLATQVYPIFASPIGGEHGNLAVINSASHLLTALTSNQSLLDLAAWKSNGIDPMNIISLLRGNNASAIGAIAQNTSTPSLSVPADGQVRQYDQWVARFSNYRDPRASHEQAELFALSLQATAIVNQGERSDNDPYHPAGVRDQVFKFAGGPPLFNPTLFTILARASGTLTYGDVMAYVVMLAHWIGEWDDDSEIPSTDVTLNSRARGFAENRGEGAFIVAPRRDVGADVSDIS